MLQQLHAQVNCGTGCRRLYLSGMTGIPGSGARTGAPSGCQSRVLPCGDGPAPPVFRSSELSTSNARRPSGRSTSVDREGWVTPGRSGCTPPSAGSSQ